MGKSSLLTTNFCKGKGNDKGGIEGSAAGFGNNLIIGDGVNDEKRLFEVEYERMRTRTSMMAVVHERENHVRIKEVAA
jgi:hypothetical protein